MYFTETQGKNIERINLEPDKLLPIEITLCNFSPDEGTFDYKLNMVHKSNPNALRISSLGLAITEPRDYILPHGCTNVVLEVEKGAIAYSYSDVTLRMAVPCESALWNGNGMARMFDKVDITFTLDFLRPCPRVVFAGITEQEGVFVYNGIDTTEKVMLVIQNDDYSDITWKDSTRLENVLLQYRKSYSNDEVQKKEPWITGLVDYKLSDGSEVEYNEHDAYGFMRLFWDVTSVIDDYYEVRVVTMCTVSGGKSHSQPAGRVGRAPKFF
jgi:hypothetical protein